MNLDRQVTISFTFRPLRLLRNLVMLTVIVGLFVYPIRRMDSSVHVHPKSFAQLSQESAVKAVDRVLVQRMDYLDPPRREELARTIVNEALSCDLDPLFALAVGDAESRMDHEAVSPTGARGMYQVIPSTWKKEVARRGLGRLEKFNVADNAKVGIGYLCYLSKQFKRPDSLLLAYNQGPGAASAILTNKQEPSEEAASYGAKVWKSYHSILAIFGLLSDAKHMRQYYKSPDSTVYTPVIGYNSDVHGPDPRPPPLPKKAKPPVKAKPLVSPTSMTFSNMPMSVPMIFTTYVRRSP